MGNDVLVSSLNCCPIIHNLFPFSPTPTDLGFFLPFFHFPLAKGRKKKRVPSVSVRYDSPVQVFQDQLLEEANV